MSRAFSLFVIFLLATSSLLYALPQATESAILDTIVIDGKNTKENMVEIPPGVRLAFPDIKIEFDRERIVD